MPKKPVNKKVSIGCGIVTALLVLVIAISVAAQNNSNSSTPSSNTSQQGQSTPADQSTSQPTSQPTIADENFSAIKPTNGTPTIGGQISDFLGKYGIPTRINGNDAGWFLNSDGSLLLVARDTGSGDVGYMSVSTPGDWSQQKVKDYCMSFAPADYTLDQSSIPYNSQGLYVYNSPSGKFALHMASTSCQINTLP